MHVCVYQLQLKKSIQSMLVSAGADVNMLFDHNFTEETVALLQCVLTLSRGTISSVAGDVKSTAQG